MKHYLVSTVYGYYVVDSDGNVVDSIKKGPDGAKELRILFERNLGLKLFTLQPELSEYAEVVAPWYGSSLLYSHERLGGALGLPKAETLGIIRTHALELTKRRIAAASSQLDRLAAEAVKAVDEFDKTLNVFASRIREWYGLHFPELGELVDDNATYLRLVSSLGLRENFTKEALTALGIPEDKSERISGLAKRSMGATLAPENFEPIRVMSESVYKLYSLRNSLTGYIDRLMADVAPNLREFVGSVLGARLIALAGSLERLARFPSSTVQVLGAEKALFRAIRKGARPPKHGAIFQDPLIHNAPKWQRGKIARAYAGKISIAARVDFYGGETISQKLREDFENRVKEIRSNFPNPPDREDEKKGYRERRRDRPIKRWRRR
jgi:nucleolar protein 56